MATNSIIVPSTGTHEKTIIWLHGFSLNAADMQQRIQNLDWYDTSGVKNIFLNAPSIYVDWASISASAPFPSGMYNSWFNYDASFPRTNDTSGIQASVQTVINTINSEIAAGIDPGNIILGGFSQGASIALLSAMQYSSQLGGVLAFDTFIPNVEGIVYTTTPIFLTHGINDSIIPISRAEGTKDEIILDGTQVSWNTYTADHEINNSMLNDADLFLNTQYNSQRSLSNTVAESHLSRYGISMDTAKTFIMSNLNNLKTVFDTCKQYGVNNDMIAEIVGGGFTGSQVEGYFNERSFSGAELGRNFEFSSSWLSGRTIYQIEGNNPGANAINGGDRQLINDITTMTFNSDGSLFFRQGTESAAGTWSVDNKDTVAYVIAGNTDYMRATGAPIGNGGYVTYTESVYSRFATNSYYTPEAITTDLAAAQALVGLSIPASNVFQGIG